MEIKRNLIFIIESYITFIIILLDNINYIIIKNNFINIHIETKYHYLKIITQKNLDDTKNSYFK